jgi:hypothetical protein
MAETRLKKSIAAKAAAATKHKLPIAPANTIVD